jgi:hypothetical protein
MREKFEFFRQFFLSYSFYVRFCWYQIWAWRVRKYQPLPPEQRMLRMCECHSFAQCSCCRVHGEWFKRVRHLSNYCGLFTLCNLLHLFFVWKFCFFSLMFVPCIIRRSRNNQHYALFVPLLYSIYWPLHVSAVANSELLRSFWVTWNTNRMGGISKIYNR